MRALFSIILELGSMIAVFFWLSLSKRMGRKSVIKSLGGAFVASGACSYVGVKYFNLAVFGRYSVMTDETGEGACLFMLASGAGLLVLYFVAQAIASLWRRFSNRNPRA